MSVRRISQFVLLGLLLLLAGLVNGCFSSDESRNLASAIEPLPPVFLVGPVAALLTNAGGFSAHVVLSNDVRRLKTVTGELFVREGKLLFAADPLTKNSGGAFVYVADLVDHQGFVWSEALQGYAPVSLSGSPADLSTHLEDGLVKIDGHPCQVVQASVKMNDGSTNSFRVFRALDLNRVPVLITSSSNSPTLTLSLSKIRPGLPPADVFTPPPDFTKYTSPEMMVTELIMRQHNLVRRPSSASETIYNSRTGK
jgi:hypothetical protein